MTAFFVFLVVCAVCLAIAALLENKKSRMVILFPFIFLAYVMLLGVASFLELMEDK